MMTRPRTLSKASAWPMRREGRGPPSCCISVQVALRPSHSQVLFDFSLKPPNITTRRRRLSKTMAPAWFSGGHDAVEGWVWSAQVP
jgi:hypothetical protein